MTISIDFCGCIGIFSVNSYFLQRLRILGGLCIDSSSSNVVVSVDDAAAVSSIQVSLLLAAALSAATLTHSHILYESVFMF